MTAEEFSELQHRLIGAETNVAETTITDLRAVLRDARLGLAVCWSIMGTHTTLIQKISQELRTLTDEQGLPHSTRRIAVALEQAAQRGWGSVAARDLLE